jgi:hypothetical protein
MANNFVTQRNKTLDKTHNQPIMPALNLGLTNTVLPIMY